MQLTLSYIYYFLVHAFLLDFECVIKLIASNFFSVHTRLIEASGRVHLYPSECVPPVRFPVQL